MKPPDPRRAWLIAGVVGIIPLVVATAWLLLAGTRGAEIASVLSLPVSILIGLASLAIAVRQAQKEARKAQPKEQEPEASWRPTVLRAAAVAGIISCLLVATLVFRVLAPSGQPDSSVSHSQTPTASASTIPPIAVPQGPWHIALTPDGTRAYITNRDQSTVTVIDTRSRSVVTTLSVWAWPVGVAISPDGRRAYVTRQTFNDKGLPDADTGMLTVIDTASNTVVNEIKIKAGGNIVDVAITPDGRYAYLTEADSHSLITVDTLTEAVYQIPFFTDSPGHVVFSPDGKRAYVSNLNAFDIVAIDTATKAQLGHVPVDAKEMAMSPGGDRLYVTTNSSTVLVVDATKYEVVKSIPVAGGAEGIDISRDGQRLCVANPGANTISVIDAAAQSVLASIPVQEQPQDVAVSPDGARAFVTNWGSNSVSAVTLPG